MQKPAVSIMQDALIAFLQKQFKSVVRTVEVFDGLWTDAEIQTRIKSTPAIYVTWLGNRAERMNEKIHTWSIIVFMTTVSNRPHDRELANQIIEYIEHTLHREILTDRNGDEIGGPLLHIKSDNLWHASPKNAGFTLYGITFEQAMYPVYEDDSDMGDFLTYYEKVVDGDLTLIETLVKPQENNHG